MSETPDYKFTGHVLTVFHGTPKFNATRIQSFGPRDKRRIQVSTGGHAGSGVNIHHGIHVDAYGTEYVSVNGNMIPLLQFVKGKTTTRGPR